jgi:hypothetical protein
MTGELTSDWLAVEDLTDPEKALREAVLAHRWWEPLPVRPEEVIDAPKDADWSEERTVRAQVLYQLLTGKGPPNAGADWDIAPRAVRVRGARIVGQLDLEAATLRCPLELVGCWLDHDAGPVLLREAKAPAIRLLGCWLPVGLDAGQVTTRGDVDLRRCRVQGAVRLIGGHVGGQLLLSGGKFRNEGGTAVDAGGVWVDQDVFCREGFEADGNVRFVGGHIGGWVDLDGGKFRNERGTAVSAERVWVGQGVFCREGFEADGEVLLRGAHVCGPLDLTGGKFRSRVVALTAIRVQVDANLHWVPAEVVGLVLFGSSSVGLWFDAEEVLGIPVNLHQLRYDGLFGVPPMVTAAQRIAWLGRDPVGYSPQPYSQLAKVYRAEGYDRAAREVLVASQIKRRSQQSGWRGLPGRAWSRLLWATVGYGYRPWLALLWLIALVVGGSLVVDALPDQNFEEGSGAPPFNSLLYTVDVLLPFIDLGYGKWVAVGAAQIVTFLLVVLGWVLATAVIAAFAGVLRRGD